MINTNTFTSDQSEPNNKVLSISLLISFLIFVHLVFFSVLYFKAEASNYLNEQQISPANSERVALENYESHTLKNFSWANKDNMTVTVPIDMVIDDVISHYR